MIAKFHSLFGFAGLLTGVVASLPVAAADDVALVDPAAPAVAPMIDENVMQTQFSQALAAAPYAGWYGGSGGGMALGCGEAVGAVKPWSFYFSQTADYGTNLALPITLTPANTLVSPVSDLTQIGILNDAALLNPLDPLVGRFEDDWQFQTLAGATRTWAIDGDSAFAAGYSYYQSLHPRLEQLDLMSHSALANYSRRISDNAVLGLDYSYLYYFLDGSSFVSQSTVGPSLLMRMSDWWDVKATVSYANASFRDTGFLNSDNYATTLEGIRYVDADRQNYLLFGAGYGYSNAVDETYSYNVPIFYVGGRTAFGADRLWQASITGSYSCYLFQGTDPIQLGVRREDNIYAVNPILARTITDNMQLFLSYLYYNSDSNVDRQSYNQNIVSLGVNFVY